MELPQIVLLPWTYGPLVSLAAVLALWLIKRRGFALIVRMAARTATRMDDLFLDAAGRPLNLLIIASGLLLLGRLLPLNEEADTGIALAYKFCVIAAFVWFIDRLARELIDMYSKRVAFIGQGRAAIQGGVRALFFTLGGMILLDSMGISITPLIASLGVGSLAVALALQGTLANMFAGLHLMADKAVERGQHIGIGPGQEGQVEGIGWRSTRIRTQSNVTLIVPNAKLVDSVISNYDLPAAQTAVQIPVGVHYDSDLGQVESVTLDVARQVLRDARGGQGRSEPVLRYTAFAESSITFVVILTAPTWSDQPLIRHEFLKRLHDRYRREGIVIPYPVRTLDLPDRVLERLAPAT